MRSLAKLSMYAQPIDGYYPKILISNRIKYQIPFIRLQRECAPPERIDSSHAKISIIYAMVIPKINANRKVLAFLGK